MRLTVRNQPTYLYTGTPRLPESGPTVVFIHGAQNDHSVWGLQSRYLAHHGCRVLAVDLPGHGRSAGSPIESIDEYASWIIDLLDASNTQQAWLVGHSMGSLIALATAASHPGRINGIALVGTAYPMKVSDVLLDAAANDEARAIEMIANWSHSGLNHHPAAPGPGFSVYMGAIRLMQRQAPGVLLTDFNACHTYTGGEAAADALQCPVMFVSGAQDMMTPPRAANGLFERINANANSPAPTRVTLDHCGHQIMGEQSEALRRALDGFIVR